MTFEEEKSISMLSKDERERRIINYLKEGKTYRQITHLTHANPTQIRNAKKKMEGVENQPPIHIQAFKMFKEGKKPVDVIIALGISTQETLRYRDEYLRLEGDDVIIRARQILGNDVVPFAEFFKEIYSDFGLEHMKEASRIAYKMDEAKVSLALIKTEIETKTKAAEELAQKYNGLENGYTQRNLAGINLPPEMISKIMDSIKSVVSNHVNNQTLYFNSRADVC